MDKKIKMNFRTPYIILVLLFVMACGCSSKEKVDQALFEMLDSDRTGLDFNNKLEYNQQFNLFKYIYFYNGSGVGAGDFNNDGLIDLFFGSNQGQNKIYLNEGDIKFKDITQQANIPQDGDWTTGISIIDINNDGLLDIYVCRVGDYEILHSKNQLLINQGVKNGIPVFDDQAKEYGLDFSGFSTQAAFFDYDNDGDQDMYLLNHSVHENGTFRPRKDFANTYHEQSGDRIFRNDGKIFTDVTRATGINSSAIGYGLGIAISDINLDGYPDIYIGNDFHENDYLYINQQNGTFKEVGEQSMMHTSQFSMGVDVADVNNDAYPEIISLDMLPSDPYILKRSLGEDAYDIFRYKISVGYAHQYTRNNLQYNRGNGMFSEIGLYSGVAATDWSWAPLWMDFDNDGLKDLFISNGIPKRMNDIDYINFISNGEIQQKIRTDNMQSKDMSLIDKFPEIKLPNKFFKNKGNLSFDDLENKIQSNEPTFSNGAVYADLDNDGDLDIIVNNIDHPAIVYRNNNGINKEEYVSVNLRGPANNLNAIGSRIVVFSKNEIRSYEKFPVRGFLSSMEIPMHLGIKNTSIDSMFIIWPDKTYQPMQGSGTITISYQEGLPLFDFNRLKQGKKTEEFVATDITNSIGLDYQHKENHFMEFDREPLIPHMISTEGPAVCVADINQDGRDDVFVGGARNNLSAIFLQQPSGTFLKTSQPELDKDSVYENVDACWSDMNNDGFVDLVVASGGNEFYGNEFHNSPRIYINDGNAKFARLVEPFDSLFMTASCITAYDFNKDGFNDLFIGGRAVPWEYGQLPESHLLLNDKMGRFIDVTNKNAKELLHIGFVTKATWFDIDKDNDADLLISLEWGTITVFLNNNGQFTKKDLTDKKGWWNSVTPCDIDNDGDIDLICGNLGWNSRLKASKEQPVRLYYNDFDGNGKKEQILTYYLQGKELPFANKSELEKQMPVLKKKFLFAKDFASSSLEELFGADKLKKAELQTADYFSNAILINNGNMQFETVALPWEGQLTPFKDAVPVHANNDSLPDILLAGNYYDNNIEMGRYDADYGSLLINKGKAKFEYKSLNGLSIKGQVHHIKPIHIGKHLAYILGRNNDSLKIIQFNKGM